MLLTGAQPPPSKCREHVWRLFKFDHFSGVACCRSSASPHPPFRFLPPACLSPNPPAPPKQKLSFAKFSRGCARSEHQSKTSCQISPETVQFWASASVVGTVSQPILNRFATDLQPICNRFSTDFQPRSPTTTDLQPFSTARQTSNRFSTVFQPFFNRFSTVFQPIFNRFSTVCATDFQPCSEAGGPKWPQRVGDTRVLHKENGR